MPVGVAELLRGLPGDVDLDVLLALRERGIEPGLLPVGESFLPGAEDVADPVERITSASAVPEGVLLDAAADLIDRGGAELDDVERVEHRDGIVELVVEGLLVGTSPLHSRMVVGWAMAPHMRTELISSALRMAHTHGRVAPRAIFHSDRGSQYTSAEYAAVAAELDIRLSVGRTGSCLDNAVAESWFSMLKNEMYHRRSFATRTQARFHVMQYIEVFYNRRRRHSTLGYRTPADVHAEHTRQTAAAA